MEDSDLNGVVKPNPPYFRRGGLLLAVASLFVMISIFVGVRYSLIFAVGLGFGIALEGLGFGFSGPWRSMILKRDPSKILAQLLSIGVVTIVALPLIETSAGEISGAQAPIGWAMVAGAFVFGIAMQVLLGCGSGTLVNAGSGNPISLLALPFFSVGSFLGSYHLAWWTELGTFPIKVLTGWSGVGLTIAMLVGVSILLCFFAVPQYRKIQPRYIIAAAIIASLALLNLIISGQPWGVVYGLGLWSAKVAVGLGAELSGSVFYTASTTADLMQESILTDYTSLTNIGIVFGAYVVSSWRIKGFAKKIPSLPMQAWGAIMITGFVMGYAARLAFGCNVGAFFSGISTGSLHGWVWFAAAFLGSYYGIKLRPFLGLEVSN